MINDGWMTEPMVIYLLQHKSTHIAENLKAKNIEYNLTNRLADMVWAELYPEKIKVACQ